MTWSMERWPTRKRRVSGTHGRVLVRGNHIEHWLNGVKVAEIDYGSDAWKEAFAASKFKTNPKFAAEPKGHIVLQDHGDEVWFRNMKIRALKAE